MNKQIVSEKTYKILVFILFGIVFVTSFYKFGSIPNYINVDEAGTILNAKTLELFGTDRYGISNPLYPRNYYSGQSILATLLVTISNNNIYNVRLPYAIIRCICSVFVFYTLDEKKERLYSLFLYAIWPVFIMSSRFVLDCNLMLYILIIAVFFIFKYFRNKKIMNLFLSSIFFGLTFYAYALAYIFIPLTLLILFIYTLVKKEFKLSIKEIFVFIIPIIIMGLPLLIRVFVDQGYFEEFMFLGITFNRILSNRSTEINIKNISMESIINLFKCIFIKDKVKSLSYKFGGPCYYLPIILVFLYFIKSKSEQSMQKATLTIMLIVSFLIGVVLNVEITWRFNYIYVPLLYISSISLGKLDHTISRCFIAAFICMFIIFSYNYLFNYGKQYDSVVQDNGLYEAYKFAKEFDKDIYVENSRLGEEYVYYFLFDESIDLKDYPKEYYPNIIYDSRNDRSIYLSFDDVDPYAMYFIFDITDEVKQNYKNIKQFGSWNVCYN